MGDLHIFRPFKRGITCSHVVMLYNFGLPPASRCLRHLALAPHVKQQAALTPHVNQQAALAPHVNQQAALAPHVRCNPATVRLRARDARLERDAYLADSIPRVFSTSQMLLETVCGPFTPVAHKRSITHHTHFVSDGPLPNDASTIWTKAKLPSVENLFTALSHNYKLGHNKFNI